MVNVNFNNIYYNDNNDGDYDDNNIYNDNITMLQKLQKEFLVS